MWLNGTIENDSPASGVSSERLHSYYCFLLFCRCHKQESKAYMRRPHGARNQQVTVRPKMAHIKFESCECMFSAQARFLEFEVEGAQKRERVMVYCLFWHRRSSHKYDSTYAFSSNRCGHGVFPVRI